MRIFSTENSPLIFDKTPVEYYNKPVSIILDQVEKWLNEMGIRNSRIDRGTILISRDDMVNLVSNKEEGDCYTEVLKSLRADISSQLIWQGKDDDWYHLGCL